MSIDSLDDLRPGDIMISGQSTAPAKLLVYAGQLLLGEHFRIGPFAAGHAGVITPGGKLVEAMPSGARERDLHSNDWSRDHIYFRLPEDYDGQHLVAASMARLMIGTPYSIMSYVYLASHRFGCGSAWMRRRINRRRLSPPIELSTEQSAREYIPVEAICSVLADQAWTLAGKKVFHGAYQQLVTPGMLTKRLWLDRNVECGGFGLES